MKFTFNFKFSLLSHAVLPARRRVFPVAVESGVPRGRAVALPRRRGPLSCAFPGSSLSASLPGGSHGRSGGIPRGLGAAPRGRPLSAGARSGGIPGKVRAP